MVIDVVNGLSIPRFLVYDIVTYRGESYLKRPFFPDRLSCIKTNIVGKLAKISKYSWFLVFFFFLRNN